MFQVYKAVSIGLQQGKHRERGFSGLVLGGKRDIWQLKARLSDEHLRISHEHKAHISLVPRGMVSGLGWVLQGMISLPLKSSCDSGRALGSDQDLPKALIQ